MRSYLTDGFVLTVRVGSAVGSIGRSVQDTLHPAATEGGRWRGGIVDRQRVAVPEAGRAGVALLGEDHLNTHQPGFVGQQRNEAGMRDAHEGLVVASPQVRFLLPERILADHQRPDALSYEQVDDASAGRVQIVVNPAASASW